MNKLPNLNLDLPFEYEVICYIINDRDEMFVAVKRDNYALPYAAYRLDSNGKCNHGLYYYTRNAAQVATWLRATSDCTPQVVADL